MPSFTSNSERVVPQQPWVRIFLISALALAVALGAWESMWRAEGFDPAPQNTNGLWAQTRRRADADPIATVIVGSSRVMFDIDLAVWARETGSELPVQLALEGTSPRPFLHNLAMDADFRGFVVVGVTPGLFFSTRAGFRADAIEHYHNETPAQWMGQQLSVRLERVVGFMDPETKLFTRLKRLAWPQRPGMKPGFRSPRRLAIFDENREADMSAQLETDAAFRQLARDIWLAFMGIPSPPLTDEDITKILDEVAADVILIRDRGGEVIFVRAPSQGPSRQDERLKKPRARTWDRLTDAFPGRTIHFEDHPGLQGYEMPEWSHIAAGEKGEFTTALATLARPMFVTWQAR
jgi:hypothetical protein